MSRTDELITIWRDYLAALNNRDIGALPRFFHDSLQFNGTTVSLTDYSAAIQSNLNAVPDFHWAIEDLTASENTVLARLTDTGTPTSNWLGNEPSGQAFTATEFAAYRFEADKVAAMWFLLDLAAIGTQLTPASNH